MKKNIAFIFFHKFFDFFNCIEKDIIWRLLNIKDFIGKVIEKTQMKIIKEYTMFINSITKLKIKK